MHKRKITSTNPKPKENTARNQTQQNVTDKHRMGPLKDTIIKPALNNKTYAKH